MNATVTIVNPGPDHEEAGQGASVPPIRTFLYLHCSDLGLARRFYSDIVGLTEIYADDTSVGYQIGTLQLTLSIHDETLPPGGWARQLGWEGGTSAAPSWGVELATEEFRRAVAAALADGVETAHGEPQWVGYWSFPVRDPMGNTVELSTPATDAWPPPD